MKYIVYIIINQAGILYKGYTSDMERRLNQHNDISKNKYTSNKGPWEIVYTKEYDNKRDALIEERRIKKLNHTALQKIIEAHKEMI